MKYSRPVVLALALATMVTPTAFGKSKGKTDRKCAMDCRSDYKSKAKECKEKKGKDRKDCMTDAKSKKASCIAGCKK